MARLMKAAERMRIDFFIVDSRLVCCVFVFILKF